MRDIIALAFVRSQVRAIRCKTVKVVRRACTTNALTLSIRIIRVITRKRNDDRTLCIDDGEDGRLTAVTKPQLRYFADAN